MGLRFFCRLLAVGAHCAVRQPVVSAVFLVERAKIDTTSLNISCFYRLHVRYFYRPLSFVSRKLKLTVEKESSLSKNDYFLVQKIEDKFL